MKIRLERLHIIGLSLLAVGIGVFIFGMVILAKCVGMKDISELSLDDLKEGMYVKGTVTNVMEGYPLKVNSMESEPVVVYTTDSQETSTAAFTAYLFTRMNNDKDEYVCVAVDQYYYTDMFMQFFLDDETSAPQPFEFEGIVTHTDDMEKRIISSADGWQNSYAALYYNGVNTDKLNSSTVSANYIRMKPLSHRKLWWLYSIPFLFAGTAFMVVAGRPRRKNSK